MDAKTPFLCLENLVARKVILQSQEKQYFDAGMSFLCLESLAAGKVVLQR